ncbi:MAG: twin-arginine translocation signal domain-containing protein [Planctomycetaceae bacterium]
MTRRTFMGALAASAGASLVRGAESKDRKARLPSRSIWR